jgi:hypothetical protein
LFSLFLFSKKKNKQTIKTKTKQNKQKQNKQKQNKQNKSWRGEGLRKVKDKDTKCSLIMLAKTTIL